MKRGSHLFWTSLAGTLAVFLSTQAWAGETLLRIMTYNVQGMIWKGLDHSRYRRMGDELARRRAEGTAPHVVLLQEMFHRKTRQLIKHAQYPYDERGPGFGILRMRSGLAILSEYPIRDTDEVGFGYCADVDCMARKGAQKVQINIPGVPFPIEFVNTHMQALYREEDPDSVHQRLEAQRRQIITLNAFMALTSPAIPLFAGGDFNVRNTDPHYALLAGQGLMSDSGEMYASAMGVQAFAENSLESQWATAIDHVFLRNPTTRVRWNATLVSYDRDFTTEDPVGKLSDHTAVETEWRITW